MPYSWSYAPTNRAGCKGKCKQKIEKGGLRFSSGGGDDSAVGHAIVSYRCFDCITDKQVQNIESTIGGLDKVDGFNELAKADQKRILGLPAKLAKVTPKAKGKAKGKAKTETIAKAKSKSASKTASEAKSKIDEPIQHEFLDKAKAHNWPATKKMLLDHGPGLVNCQPAGRWSALMQFVNAGNVDAVEFLLAQGADANRAAKDGNCARDLDENGLLGDEPEGEDEDQEEAEEEQEEEADEEAPVSSKGTKRKSEGGGARPPAKKPRADGGGRPVDTAVPGRESYKVVDDWSCLLNQTNIGANNNKYYKIQVLESKGKHYCWTHWGRVGASGAHKLQEYSSLAAASAEYKSKFRSKTGVDHSCLETHDWTPKVGKYTYLEVDEKEGAEGGDSSPLGKLTAQQIEKGQVVLEKLSKILDKPKVDMTAIGNCSSEFYTLVPHDFGFKIPPAISTKDMLETEEELLKFYLRMGFEEVEQADDGRTPLSGIMDLPLPESLQVAAGKLCNAGDLKSSVDKGKQHSSKQSGNPAKKMESHLYAAIMLYTSNAIYKDLNAALRNEDRSKIKKYFSYLRLLLEALGALPQQKKTLWRGVNVDLHDQYVKGSTVTWWGVSSCTADINVAKNFMKGCGGKCTLLTMKTKTAADISDITFFGNEKENLLAPGTQLKVLSSVKKGNTTEITMEEMGRVLG